MLYLFLLIIIYLLLPEEFRDMVNFAFVLLGGTLVMVGGAVAYAVVLVSIVALVFCLAIPCLPLMLPVMLWRLATGKRPLLPDLKAVS